MEYTIQPEEIQSNHLIFKLPIKNQNIKYKYYYKLLFSNENIHLKYILIEIHLNQNITNTYDHFYKLKTCKKDDVFFHKIHELEKMILNSLNQHISKNIVCVLYNELITKDFMYVPQQTNHDQCLHLKISGIWQDETNIGLVYKLYYAMSTENLSNMIC